MSRTTRRLACLAVVGAAALSVVPNAMAAPPSWSCDAPAQQIFAPWKDDAFYQLVDDGTFEQGAGSWDLSEGARVVQDADNGLGVADDDYALELGPGASALSPPICVTEASESFRFFSSVVQGAKDDNLQVDVIYMRKKAHEFKIKVRSASSTPVQKLKLDRGEFKRDATVRLRFTATNGATVRIDDVYMDPRLH